MLFFTLVILALSSQASLSESSSPPDILSRIKDTAKCQRFVTTLRGNEEVPIVNTNGQCKGSLRLSANKNRRCCFLPLSSSRSPLKRAYQNHHPLLIYSPASKIRQSAKDLSLPYEETKKFQL
mmetsp:Transcript_38551/g.56584  ORF Transcript_38551/g.56584 Transcript_38551/m.56584 type:complete len:123 (-) Transcript_38551:55-423(-)